MVNEINKAKNEYEEAARLLRNFAETNNIEVPTLIDKTNQTKELFEEKFSPEKLGKLNDESLLSTMFYTIDGYESSLWHFLEKDKDCANCFGGISAGSMKTAYEVAQDKKTGEWFTLDQESSFEEALEHGKKVRDNLIKGVDIINSARLDSIPDYEDLDEKLKNEIGESFYKKIWVHKYFSIICSDKICAFHSEEWQKHILRALKIRPSEKYYARSGQILMIQNYTGWSCADFRNVFIERFSEPLQFVRLGSTDENDKYYGDEWQKDGIVAIGWSKLGDLKANFASKRDQNKLDSKLVKSSLKELYYSGEKGGGNDTKKSQEICEFYASNKNTVFVVMKGKQLIACADNLGNYFYDNSAHMAHKKSAQWKLVFAKDDRLPEESEVLQKTCCELKKEENLMFAYEKYYYNKPEYLNKYSGVLLESKNIIFRGAPGTGKTYLARKIAADIVSGGETDDYKSLTAEQKEQVEFVQFHPSYDYTDFVEGLRPNLNEDSDSVKFKRQDGIFKKFADRARLNYENAHKSEERREKEFQARNALERFLSNAEIGKQVFKTVRGKDFFIDDVDEEYIYISIPQNEKSNNLSLKRSEIEKLLSADENFNKVADVVKFFGRPNNHNTHQDSYEFIIYEKVKEMKFSASKVEGNKEEEKPYVFIIDEINRGEISKIFGELFFAIDPGYRGKAGEVSTQYSYMHDDNEKFYVPENIYIIGTMNDIDRSVDSFDFAMRRRFRFIEIKPEDRIEMLDGLSDALKTETINRMNKLNETIANVDGLNENYQIGPAYFLKVEKLGFDKLWTDYLQPLLHEYIQGMYNEAEIMEDFEKAYNLEGKSDESTQN